MSAGTAERSVDPRRYFEAVERDRSEIAGVDPVCLYLETTNRCNLPCTTCPRTFEELEPAANMSWDLFRSIVDQYPNIARVVLHGVGEPLMVPNLPRMIRHLKARGTYVLFNTNGTLLNERRGRDLIASGLDELRVSLDAADAHAFKAVRGKDAFDRIVEHVRAFRALQRSLAAEKPRVSLWLTGLKETTATHGILFDASGATEPGTSLQRAEEARPWSLCTRPWTLMYFTAHGRALPCCIAPFSMRGYDAFTLGDATQQSLREIWNGEQYRAFRHNLLGDSPPVSCANCGLRWSL